MKSDFGFSEIHGFKLHLIINAIVILKEFSTLPFLRRSQSAAEWNFMNLMAVVECARLSADNNVYTTAS